MEDYRTVGKHNMYWIQWGFGDILVANKETQRLTLATFRNKQGGGGQGRKEQTRGRAAMKNGSLCKIG